MAIRRFAERCAHASERLLGEAALVAITLAAQPNRDVPEAASTGVPDQFGNREQWLPVVVAPARATGLMCDLHPQNLQVWSW